MNRKKIFIFILLISLLFAIVIRSPISVMPLIYSILAISMSYLYVLIIKNKCEILVDTSNVREFKRASKEKYKVLIRNKSFLIFPKLKFSILVVDEEGQIFDSYNYTFMLNSKEEKKLDIDIKFPHIGSYEVKISDIEIFDIFDIFSLKYNPNWMEKVIIRPRLYEIDDFDIDSKRAIFPVEFNVPQKKDGEIYDDIREYIPGDSMKNIHWKLSAHANEYMTKILKVDAVSGVSIYMDFMAKKDHKLEDMANINDTIIETAYCISNYAMENSRGVSYMYSDNNRPIISVPKDSFEIKQKIYQLPKYSKREKYNIELILSKYSNTRNSFDNVFLISNNLNLDIIATLIELSSRGKKATLCLVGKEYKSKDNILIQRSLTNSGINYYIIDSAKDFIDSLGGVKDVQSK